MANALIYLIVLVPRLFVSGQNTLCNDKLLATIPDSHITASSSRADPNVYTGPERARLNTPETTLNNGSVVMGGWSPRTDNPGEYIQAVFDEMTMINSVVTQGRNLGADYMTSYKIEYTEDGSTWQTINNNIGVEQIFMGNSDSDTPVENTLLCPIFAKGIRIVPLDTDNHVALRFEVNGCYVDNTVIILTTPLTTATIMSTIGVANATASSFLPGIQTPFGSTTTGKLNTASLTSSVATISNKPMTSPLMTQTTPKTLPANILTLIHQFITAMSQQSGTTPATTTPVTTTQRSTQTTRVTTRPVTTPTTTPTTPSTTPSTTPTTPVTTPTTPDYNFHPGIANPFATTASRATTFPPPFMPGIINPFGGSNQQSLPPLVPGQQLIG